MSIDDSRGNATALDARSRGTPDGRGGSELVGVVLLFGMVLVGVAFIFATGLGATEDILEVNYSVPGYYSVVYRAEDNEGNTSSTSVEIEVVEGSGAGSSGDGPEDGYVIGIGGSEVVVGDEE